jgi:S-adenosyl-L-methionine hydrolase (adenosine-forming)
MAAGNSSHIITLLSDLGTKDGAVASFHAMLQVHTPSARVLDVTHRVPLHALYQAAYFVRSYIYFPPGTVHILAVDALAGDAPVITLVHKEGHWFIAPDNGIIPLAFGAAVDTVQHCHTLARPLYFRDWQQVAADVAAQVFAGSASAYPAYQMKVVPKVPQQKLMDHSVDCNVLFVDVYGNVVLDITRTQFTDIVGSRPFTIGLMRQQELNSLSSTYSDVDVNRPLCHFNSAGYLEVAVNRGSAAALLNIGNDPAAFAYRSVKITF